MLGSYGYSFKGQQVLSEILQIYTSNKNTLHVWCIDYCSLSTSESYYSTQHLLNILLFATLHQGEPKTMGSESKMKVCKTETIPRLSNQNDINRTKSQCHPLNLPSHLGRQTQEHTIHQLRKDSGGANCIVEWFGPGEWAKFNSNVMWLDLEYLQGWNWGQLAAN